MKLRIQSFQQPLVILKDLASFSKIKITKCQSKVFNLLSEGSQTSHLDPDHAHPLPNKTNLLHKLECFIRISPTEKNHISTHKELQ